MHPEDQARLVRALEFALEAHGDQKRKGKDVPYVSHLLQVAGFVFEHGGQIDQAIAGLLHDVREDCPGITDEDVRARFGERVADIVHDCTDLLEEDTPDRKSEWRIRKERYIEHLGQASRDTRLVALCDKLHNLSNILCDVRTYGFDVFSRFSAGPPQQLWYFTEVRRAAGRGLPRALLMEFDLHLESLRELVETRA